MRALAEFIMRGRVQASLIALLASGLPLISPAAVALVTLRRGAFDGMLVMSWACMPMLLLVAFTDMEPVFFLLGLASLIGYVVVVAVATLLRATMSWPVTLMAMVILSTLSAFVFLLLAPEVVLNVVKAINEAVAQTKADMPQHEFNQVLVMGLVAYAVSANTFFGLIMGRWWQALLYNPGGFQTEFHQLRLKSIPALMCLLATWYCLQDVDYRAWVNVFALPLLAAGAALIHYVVKARQLGRHWLVMFYLAVMVFSPLLVPMLTVVVFLDTWLDFRSRLTTKS